MQVLEEIILRRIQYPRPLFPSILKRTIGSSDKERRLLRTATDSPRWLLIVVVLKPTATLGERVNEEREKYNKYYIIDL